MLRVRIESDEVGDGKTTLTAAIQWWLARLGYEVLLIPDACDIRVSRNPRADLEAAEYDAVRWATKHLTTLPLNPGEGRSRRVELTVVL